ncbi:MAG: hypothetical protein HY287_02470 [Planctomycetes bacterium]|nr:hypothetical protein [Planctomycetota bacterium]MBI3833174.1 hypothetical protein [Planctomycetota bacterium]
MTTTDTQALADFIRELTSPQPTPLDPAVIKRVNGIVPMPDKPGRVKEIDEETYWWFLEVLPPHYFDGWDFCFAEGFMPYLFFFVRRGRYYVRQLTNDETHRFCQLGNIPLPGYW